MIRRRKHLLLLFGLAIGMFGFAFPALHMSDTASPWSG